MKATQKRQKSTAIYKIRLQKGDLVVVRTGREKGRTGKVLATHPRLNKVTVEGIGVVKKHVKPTVKNQQGGILEITKPIWVSKVSIVEPTSKKASRVSYKTGADGNGKIRVYQKTGKEIK